MLETSLQLYPVVGFGVSTIDLGNYFITDYRYCYISSSFLW